MLTPSSIVDQKVIDIEIDLLLQGLLQKYGYDFTQYAKAGIRRRVLSCAEEEGEESVASYIHSILKNSSVAMKFVSDFSVTSSEIFRHPEFFKTIATKVVPVLKTYPSIKIWIAGCGNGEEVYSTLIMLEESGLLDKAIVYATDISHRAIRYAQTGTYSSKFLRVSEDNYKAAGGLSKLQNYYDAKDGKIRFKPSLVRNVVFSSHNLVGDHVFCEAHLIICRNVLVLFTPPLMEKVVSLFGDSLVRRGFLALAPKDTYGTIRSMQQFELFAESKYVFRETESRIAR